MLVVPGLVTFAAAVVAARLLVPMLRALGRAGRRGPLPLRLAALSLSRNPGQATVTATFLVASLGLALFALAYRATLVQGQRDEASYAVPAPYMLDEDLLQLVPVLHGGRIGRRDAGVAALGRRAVGGRLHLPRCAGARATADGWLAR